MKKSKSKLEFTQEEQAGKSVDKLKSDKVKTKSGQHTKKKMKVKDNLHFEEDKKKPSEKLKSKEAKESAAHRVIKKQTRYTLYSQNNEDDNDSDISENITDNGTMVTAQVLYHIRTYERSKRHSDKENKNIDKSGDTVSESNSYSKWKQKQDIKKRYYGDKSCETTVNDSSADEIKTAVKNSAKNIEEKLSDFFKENKKVLIVAGGILLAVIIAFSLLSSGSILVQSTAGGVSFTTYPSDDSEMIAANDYYTELENKLLSDIEQIKKDKRRLYSYKTTTSRSTEYSGDVTFITVKNHIYRPLTINSNIAEIDHDPYELISCLTAKNDCEAFTCNEMKSTMNSICNLQYKLSYSVKETKSTNTTTSARVVYEYDEDGAITGYSFIYTENITVTHYYTLNISLTNNSIDDVTKKILTDEQQEMYEIYQETKGNRPDLFE